MSILTRFETEQICSILRTSNYWAKFNRNRYPEKIQEAINDVYRWIECPCADDCECRNHGCTHHLVVNHPVKFNVFFDHFLECYVDVRAHDSVKGGRVKGRASNAVIATNYIRSIWGEIQKDDSQVYNKSLICTDWESDPFVEISESFRPAGENIYMAKWLSLLAMGIYIAYDSSSVGLLNRDFDRPITYRHLIGKVRADLIMHLNIVNRDICYILRLVSKICG